MSASFTAAHRGGTGSPLVCLHGFTDTWRTWELVLPALERHHDVLAPTLAGHAGGPPLPDDPGEGALADAVEQAMDAAGFAQAHIVGNSLGGYVALQLAARGRALSIVALAPGGGWIDDSYRETMRYFPQMQKLVAASLPQLDAIVASRAGRRRATAALTVNFEHIPPDLIAHIARGAAGCASVELLVEHALRYGWELDADAIECPVRVVWGTEDQFLPWPSAAARFRQQWLPDADWIELDGVGHCPQLDVPSRTAELILSFTADAAAIPQENLK